MEDNGLPPSGKETHKTCCFSPLYLFLSLEFPPPSLPHTPYSGNQAHPPRCCAIVVGQSRITKHRLRIYEVVSRELVFPSSNNLTSPNARCKWRQ